MQYYETYNKHIHTRTDISHPLYKQNKKGNISVDKTKDSILIIIIMMMKKSGAGEHEAESAERRPHTQPGHIDGMGAL